MQHENQRRWALVILSLIVSAAALKIAQPIMAPLALAFVLAIVLSPINAMWTRTGVGSTAAVILTSLSALMVLAVGAIALSPVVRQVYDQWPMLREEMLLSMKGLRASFRSLIRLQEQVAAAISPTGDGAVADTATTAMPSLTDAALLAPHLLGQILICLGGMFFFLLCKADFYVWLSDFLGKETTKTSLTPDSFRAAEAKVAQYFSTVAIINTGFGIAVGAGLAVVGLPGAILWGVVAGLSNFIVYLGAAVTAVLLLIAGNVSFDGYYALLPVAVFVALNFAEGQFITPSFVSRQMSVNPLLVFLSLTFWLWLWGAVGGIVAIPLLVWYLELLAASRGELAEPDETVAQALPARG